MTTEHPPPADENTPVYAYCMMPEDHHWAVHVRGGEPLHIRQCTICREFDWPDLREQLKKITIAAMQRVVGIAVEEIRKGTR